MFVQNLDGVWELRQTGFEEAITARVPGCVHLDLLKAKKIEDPFVGDNELKVSWVHESDWEYTRVFEANDKLFKGERIFLECDGLDTIAQVKLNNKILGETENMYIRHKFDVTGKIQPGENHISVRFKSPVNHARALVEKAGDTISDRSYVRKSPSQYGWDWGPVLPTSGIWRPIRLASYGAARIEDVRVVQRHRKDGRVILDVQIPIERFKRNVCVADVTLTHPDGTVDVQQVKVSSSGTRCSFDIAKPQLWWPNGYGDQPLYKLEAVLLCGTQKLDSFTQRIGLRTIKLDQKKDSIGRSFTFVVNGVKIFCKGANWIPADSFPSRVTEDRLRHLISSAASANMNMLRVWGGGFYEDEKFYDLCDEYGILVWQDFMFACSLYPATKDFLENVRKDVEHNVIRLRNRACLALWCGNNEVEWLLLSGQSVDNNSLRRRHYVKLFYDMIPSIISKTDPFTAYWPSSPASDQPFVDPNGESSGDGHYWDVWHGKLPFTAYRTQFHRFMSEFGFESLPAYETCKTYAKDEDLNITSYVMECHQKNGAGNGLILHYMAQTFRMPKDFEMTCYVSQILQAEAMRYGVEHWRRNRGRCMGTLYWQLNDCWPVSSWSSIDYFGRWKALNYMARRFYSPVAISVCEDDTRAEIHVTNDTVKPARVEVRWSLEKFDGTVIRKSKIKTRIEPEQNKMLANLDFTEELQSDEKLRCALVYELWVNGKCETMGMTPFVPSKHLDLPKTRISVKQKTDEQGAYLEVSSSKAARFVWLSVPKQNVIFSDNCFDLPAGRTVCVRIIGDAPEDTLAKVRAYSLRDSY